MTQKILEAEGEGDSVQLDFFLKGNLALEKNSRCKPHSWLPDQVGFMGSLHLLNSLFTVLSRCASTQAASKLHTSQYPHKATLVLSGLASNLQALLALPDCPRTCLATLHVGLPPERCNTCLQGWEDVMRLVEIGKAKEGSPLATLADDIERNEVAWKEWAALEAPEAALMPADLTAKLSLFEQLLVSPDPMLWCVCVCVCI